MKGLTNQELTTLLEKIKSFLSISWTDLDYDTQLKDFIVSSILAIDSIAGKQLDYLTDSSTATVLEKEMNALGFELLRNRVFYLTEKALDDFDKNYQNQIVQLYMKGRIYANQQENN